MTWKILGCLFKYNELTKSSINNILFSQLNRQLIAKQPTALFWIGIGLVTNFDAQSL